MGDSSENLKLEMREMEEKGRESSCCSSSDFPISETTRHDEEEEKEQQQSSSSIASPISSRWSMKNIDGEEEKKKKIICSESRVSEIEMMKERFSKLLLGEDMSGSGNGVCTALAISNAITNLCATLFGQLWRLEPLSKEKKEMWRREMEWLLCVSDHIVEMIPTWQTFPDGTKLEIMTCRPRSDLYVNLPALKKLDNMLLEILDSFKETEFWYIDQGIMAQQQHESSSAASDDGSFRKSFQRQEDKWWLPVPRVSPGGLGENSRKQLQHKRDCTNQILKAAMAINSITLADMEIPESYLESLPRRGRSCLGDLIYRYISSDQFSPECLLDCLDLSSEHQAIEIANRVESSIYLWHKRTNSKPATTSWEMVKELMVDAEKLELMADRAESLLISLKQRFPGLPQTALDMSKIQYNKDIGKSILESYSRVLESLAFNIVARIDDLLFVDDLTRHSSDQIPKTLGNNDNNNIKLPPVSVSVSTYTTPSYSPAKTEHLLRPSSITMPPSPSRFKIPHSSSVKRVLTAYVTKNNEPRSKDVVSGSEKLSNRSSSSSPSSSERLSLERCMKETLNVSNVDPGI